MDKPALINALSSVFPDEAETVAAIVNGFPSPFRRLLPSRRLTERITVTADGQSIDVEVGFYDDGLPAELFLECNKQGTLLRDLLHGVAFTISIGLQHGISLETYVSQFLGAEFDTGEGNLVLDAVFKGVLNVVRERQTVPREAEPGDQRSVDPEAGTPASTPHP